MSNNSKESKFVPYVPASKSLPELTVTAIVLGIILAIVFGAANAYLGLLIGLTVSASIPAAVISMAILRGIFRRKSILENNIVQTMTTAGEAVAAGAVFTIPALFLWDMEITQGFIIFIVLTGGFLGVFMMVPLRQLLIVREHETLPYPEGTACAEVLKSGEKGGTSAKLIGIGLVIGGVIKALGDGFKLFKTEVETGITNFKNAVVGLDAFPALLGVGYIIGPRVAGQMLAGGLLAWIVIIPMISFFGGSSATAIFPSDVPIGELDAWGIWDSYIRYIGAGAVATGGLITLVKTLPILFSSLFATAKSLQANKGKLTAGPLRTEQDMPAKYVWLGTIIVILVIAFSPLTDVGIIGAVAIAIFGFLFVTVASRVVGVVGSSSSPVSGMTIATLLIVAVTYKVTGFTGTSGMIAAITVAAIICTALAVAGDISQDLKTGYIVGGTPWKQQIAMMIGVLASASVIGFILILMDRAYTMGSAALPAPKAALMKILAEGVLGGDLPWTLIFIGAAIAITLEFCGLNSLVVAVGIYLPVHTSAPIMIGGFVRYFVERRAKTEEVRKERVDRGTLFASGLIAGESLVGVLIAILIAFGLQMPDAVVIASDLFPFLLFLVLAGVLWYISNKGKKRNVS
ncbi:OPT family oligopeptide transporter [Peribacillus asahii]|uniref:OPT family oligopeptide transporter n=1 Tax=Peribacillus asahii TaxID=228899 RepID=UPI00207A572A|nr:oligopeptide transporter, OPT family [Peribacillus asahii]USK70666.1 oligopeptide transporter, OPT family [Peribacillus asahii]